MQNACYHLLQQWAMCLWQCERAVWEKSAQDIRMVSDLNAFSVAVLLFYLCFVMFLDMFAAFC